MRQDPALALLDAIASRFASGLPQDASVAHYIRSTHGDLPPQRLEALVADGDDPQGASLAELLLFPGEDTARALEPALAAAALDDAGVAALAANLGQRVIRATAILPDGTRLAVPVSADAAARFVSRLGPQRTLPAAAAACVAERFGDDAALALAVAARRTGPVPWTPGAASLARAVASRLPADAPDAQETLHYVVRFLGGLAQDTLPLPALIARRSRLAAQLRRARQQEQAMKASNFETLAMTGARLPYLHAPDIARELALADAAILAATGRPAPDTTGSCLDMGVVADMDGLLAALDDQAD
ncbi:hypothetical protein [Solidesulfovibrio alcoholivorans]|uniref:hypothetical protein n=1 Tax=Solidesulfovibrio alcoholivorans TaxID=81406 RepID=UPI0012EC3B7B|nr:hypothetical protein [Solidesulfovibrio alcoholivorans]